MNLFINDRIVNGFDDLIALLNKIDIYNDDSERQDIIEDVISSFENDKTGLIPWLKEDCLPLDDIISRMEDLHDSYTERPDQFAEDSVLFESICSILTQKNQKIFYDAKDYIEIDDIIVKVNGNKKIGRDIYFNQNIITSYKISIQFAFKVRKPLNETFKFTLSSDDAKSISKEVRVKIKGAIQGSIVHSNIVTYNAQDKFVNLPSGIYDMYLLSDNKLFPDSQFTWHLSSNYTDSPSPITITSVELSDENGKNINIESTNRKALVNLMNIPGKRLKVMVKYRCNTNESMKLKLSSSLGEEQFIHIESNQEGSYCTVPIAINNVNRLVSGEHLFEIAQAPKDELKIILCVYGKSSSILIGKNNWETISGYGDSGTFFLTKKLYFRHPVTPNFITSEIEELNKSFKDNGITFTIPDALDLHLLSLYLEKAEDYEYVNIRKLKLFSFEIREAVKTREALNSKIEVGSGDTRRPSAALRLKIQKNYPKVKAIHIQEKIEDEDYFRDDSDWYLDRTMHYD